MTKTIKLSDTQLILLSAASQRDDGSVLPLPDTVSDAVKAAISIRALLKRALVAPMPVTDEARCWARADEIMTGLVITDAGRVALGLDDPVQSNSAIAPGTTLATESGADVVPITSRAHPPAEPATSPPPLVPAVYGTKLVMLIALMQRAEGATLVAMSQATNWQPHSVRAALSGFRKNGIAITSDKVNGIRTYHIAPEAA